MASSKHFSCGLGQRTVFILVVVVTLHTTLTSGRPLNGRRWRSVASPETPWPETMSTSSPANNDNRIRNVDDSEAASTFSRIDVDDDIITPPRTNVHQRPNGGDRPATDAVGDEKLCMTATPAPATRGESAPRSRWTAQLSSSPLFGGQQLSTQSSDVTFAAPRGNNGRWRLKPRSVLRSLNVLRGMTTTTGPVSGFVSRPRDVHPSSSSSSASASSVLLRSLLKREFDRKDKRQTYCCSMDMYCFNCSR